MTEKEHRPTYIPQIGIPEKTVFKDRTSTRAIYHKATSPGLFGLIVICFFMSFINIKCGGTIVARYSGVEIVAGMSKAKNDPGFDNATGSDTKKNNSFVPITFSMYWKAEMCRLDSLYLDEEDSVEEEEIIQVQSDQELEMDKRLNNFDDMNKTSMDEITRDSTSTRLFTSLALLAAIAGLVLSFIKGKHISLTQVVLGSMGFICLLTLQYYIKTTVPINTTGQRGLDSKFVNPIVTVSYGMGYWLALFLFLAVAVIGFLRIVYAKRMNKTQ